MHMRTNMGTATDTGTGTGTATATATATDMDMDTGMSTGMDTVSESRAESGTPDATLLRLIWLASPALPVGGFSYSEGLESAIDSGRIRGESEASDWLLDQLQHGLARAELCVIAGAHRAWLAHDRRRIVELNDWMLATRESSELRRQTEQMGRSMLEWLRNGEPDPRLDMLAALTPAPTFPIAFALASAGAGATPREAALSFGFGWAENMVQAAMKSVPLGQAAGQRILARLADRLPRSVDRALTTPDADRIAFLPMLAILSSQHEVQYSRLFRS